MVVNLVNQYSATVKGGLFEQYSSTLSGQSTGGSLRRAAARALSKKGTKALREILATLNGATAGSAALISQGRIEANSEQGGKRTIETETLVDETTAAADVTTVNDDLLSYSSYTASPPANLDGNPLGTR